MAVSRERRWSNQPLVRERDEHRVRLLWRTLLGIVVAVAPFGYYLIQQSEYAELSYSLSELRSREKQLQEEEQKLRFRRADLADLEEIELWAVREHGLCRPPAEQVVILGSPISGPDHLLARTGTD